MRNEMNAIILAGGHGSRMIASGQTVHKPLLPIWGFPNIERTILMLIDFGIKDITVIAGIYAEQYKYLHEKYQCKIISESTASVSTLYGIYSVLDSLGDTFIIEGDVVLAENIFETQTYSFYYTMRYPYCENDSWKPIIDRHGRIISFEVGCFSEPCVFGVSFWSQEDASFIKEFIRNISTKENLENSNKFWDDYFIDILTDIDIFTKEIPYDSATEMNTELEYKRALQLCTDYYSTPDKYFLNLHDCSNNLTFRVDNELSILYTQKLFIDYNSKHPDNLIELNQPIFFDLREYAYVVRKNKMPIGFIDLVVETHYLCLRRIYIDEIHRNQSIGTEVMRKIILFSKLINKELRVNVYDEHAAKFYKRLGFRHNFVNYILRRE